MTRPSSPDAGARIAAIVLAAGASSRLGAPKQLVRFRGEPLVHRAASAAIDAGAAPVIVVLGAHAKEVERALRGLPGVVPVVNERWSEGLASSIEAGVRMVMERCAGCEGVLITVVDQPLVDAAALRGLLDAFGAGHRLVAAAYSSTVGVPAAIGREHFGDLLRLTGDAGAGRWLRARAGEVHRVAMDDAAIDIDSVEDAAQLAALAWR